MCTYVCVLSCVCLCGYVAVVQREDHLIVIIIIVARRPAKPKRSIQIT